MSKTEGSHMFSIEHLGLFLTIFSLFGFKQTYDTPKNELYKPYYYVDLAYEIKGNVDNRISKKYGFALYGSGGEMLEKVRLIATSFKTTSPLPVTIEEARKLIIPIAKEYVSEFNSNEEIRPFLLNYPFDTRNINIAVFFQDCIGNGYKNPNLTVVHVYRGKVLYFSFRDSQNNSSEKWEYEETFEEAEEKLKNESEIKLKLIEK